MIRPVKQRVWRTLRRLERFRYRTFSVDRPEDGEEPIGIYTNPDSFLTPEIKVSSHALYFQDRRVAYAEIVRLGSASKAMEPLALRLVTGQMVAMPVMGTERDRLVDALVFHRFLRRVLEDLGRPAWPAGSEPFNALAKPMSEAYAVIHRRAIDQKDPQLAIEKFWNWVSDLEGRDRDRAAQVLVQWILSEDDAERFVAQVFVSRLNLTAAVRNLTTLATYLEKLPGPVAKYEALKARDMIKELDRGRSPE